MKKLKKVTALTMTLALSIGMLAGCGNGGKATDNDENGKITLTAMTYFSEENKEAPAVAWREMKEKFLEENPNVEIKEEVIGASDYLNKIKTQIATGDLPDVFLAGVSMEDTFVKSGYSSNLNDFIENGLDVQINEGALNNLTVDGVTYAVPYVMTTDSNIIYNSEIFEKCGIVEFPKTFDEFETALQKIKENGYIPICAGDKDNWYLDTCIFREIANRYCGEEWALGIDNNNAKFTDERFIDSLKKLKEWYDKGFFNEDLMSLNYLQHRQYYFEGEAAMYFDGSGGISPLTEECPKEVLDVTEIAALPSFDGSKVITGSVKWAITYNNKLEGRKLEAAQELIKTFCSEEGAKIVLENGGASTINDVEYDSNKVAPIVQKYNLMMSETKMEQMFNSGSAISNVLYPGLQDMLIGNITPEELAESLEVEHQKMFK